MRVSEALLRLKEQSFFFRLKRLTDSGTARSSFVSIVKQYSSRSSGANSSNARHEESDTVLESSKTVFRRR